MPSWSAKRSGAFLGVFATGVAVSFFLAYGFFLHQSKHERSYFLLQAEEVRCTLQMEARMLHGLMLSLAQFYGASEFVTRKEFQLFTSAYLEGHPYIEGFGWAPRVLKSKRSEFENRVRQEASLEGFSITQRDDQGKVVPAKPSEVYYPFMYVEPYRGNEEVLGYNLEAEVLHYKGVQEGLRRGGVTVTKPVVLVKNEDRQKSALLLLHPVYTTNNVLQSLEGVLVMALPLEKFIKQSIGIRAESLDIQIYEENSQDIPLYGEVKQARNISVPKFEKELTFIDKKWKLVIAPNAQYRIRPQMYSVYATVLFGVSFSLLLSLFVSSVIRQRESIDEEVRTKLRASKTYNEHIINRNPALVCGLSSSGEVLYVNPKVLEATGYTEKEIIGQNWWELMYPGDEYQQVEDLMIAFEQQGQVYDYEMILTTKSGEKRTVSWTSLNRYSEYGELQEIVGFGIDVTDRNEYQGQIVAAKEEAERASRTKSDFLANMSHEIRTPMNGIIGAASVLEGMITEGRAKKYVDMIINSGDQLLSVINSVLDLSKIEAGKMQFVNEIFDVHKVVVEMFQLFEVSAQDKGVGYTYSIDSAMPQYLRGDHRRIGQVVMNLLSNAIKFTHKGRVHLEIEALAVTTNNVTFKICVEDTGEGIDENEQKLLFKEFSQIHFARGIDVEGTGLGLSICKKLIETMGGQIGVESEKGKGSTFYIQMTLPIGSEKDFRESNNEGSLLGSGAVYAGKKVLLAEDVEVNQVVIGDMLHDFGIELDIASNGLEAVKMEQEKKYDLILMDLRMPHMGGLQATRAIRERHAKINDSIPIVALTAHALDQHREECLAAGMDDFLAKPVKQKQLLAMLEKIFDGKSTVGQNTLVGDIKSEPVMDATFIDQIQSKSAEKASTFAKMTVRDVETRLSDLDKAVAESNLADIAELAHALKSVTGQAGALKLSGKCKELEKLAKDSKADEVGKCAEQVKSLFAEVKPVLERYIVL